MVSEYGLPAMDLKQGWELNSRDFFRTQAQMPLREIFLMAGTRFRLSTNSESILSCTRKLFSSLPAHGGNAGLDFHFWVDHAPTSQSQPWPKPYFRGMGQFIFAGFDGFNSLLVDLKQRLVVGRFTNSFAEDEVVWKKILFPVLPAFLSPSIPVSVLHGACVEHNGNGLLLVGPSGSGKSTLALTLGRRGFGYLADDRTYLSLRNGRLFAWSAGGFLKLRSDAFGRFPLSEGGEPTLSPTGEKFIELDPEVDLGFKRVKCCEPNCLVFLERGSGAAPQLRQADPAGIAARLDRDLRCDGSDAVFQKEVHQGLAQLPCFVLNNQGSLEAVAKALCNIPRRPASETQLRSVYLPPLSVPAKASTADPLRRATPLKYTLAFSVMGMSGSLATNSTSVFESAKKLFSQSEEVPDAPPKFFWRIVSEADGKTSPPWPSSSAFSSGDLRFVNIGQRSFAAINLESAEAVGFISESLAQDEPAFATIFLATMFYLTAPILRLTPLKAGCVSKDGLGLLLLGSARSGKTSCAYASSKLGLEIHADMASFLEMKDGGVRAWGEFWPALFREDTAHTYPELKFLGRRLEHESETFIAVDKSLLCRKPARPVTVALAVVLDRQENESPRMARLSPTEYWDALQASPPYEDLGAFRALQEQILMKLARMPAYKLTYGNDSGEAAMFCRSLLTAQDILGAVP